MIIEPSIFQPYIEDKLVSVQKHPTGDLYIYNYTQKAQFDRVWDEPVKMARGLILDGKGKVIARPFDKFFNRGENGDPHNGIVAGAYDKMDGSLGIMYPLDGKLYIATRGSFTSDQAIEGTKMLERYVSSQFVKDELLRACEKYTWLFEIIYPENRIVVDYHGDRKLVLLALRDIDSGIIHTKEITAHFETPKVVDDYEAPRDNAEGVVLYYSDGFMEKVKYEEYVRLHRLVTGVTARRIWDILRNDEEEKMKELTGRVPEEFKQWVIDTVEELVSKFQIIADRAKAFVEKNKALDQKEFAIKTLEEQKIISGIIFAIRSGKDYVPIIWKMLKPKAERTFREDL